MQTQTKQVVVVEGKLRKLIHSEGQGDCPTKGQEIFALYRGTLENGEQFDSNQNREDPFTFVLGEGRVIKGWDQGFASMKKGEKATLICSPEYAYGARGSPPKIPANATLHFEVQLLDFKDKKKEKWQLSDEEKLTEGSRLKLNGNEKLKQGNYKQAINDYKQGIDYLQNETNGELKQLLNILRLNISQAYLKINKNGDAVTNCTSVLKQEEGNLKALYRRGIAYTKIQDFDKAQNDFKEILKIDPENGEAKKELSNVAKAINELKQKEKKLYGNIFSKMNLYDDVKVAPKIQPEVKKVESQDEGSDEEFKQPMEAQENAPQAKEQASEQNKQKTE